MDAPMIMLGTESHCLASGLSEWRKGEITKLTILINLIKMFREGPEVSLKGSPTVSPTTTAL